VIALEVADLRFDRAASTPTLSLGTRHVLPTLPGNVHLDATGVAMTPIAFVDVRISYCYTSDILNRRQCVAQRVTVIRIVRHQWGCYDPVAAIGRRHRHLLAKPVPLVGFALLMH